MSGDRLSRLPVPVLWQVLSHAPAKEAVSTGALSRPWRSLWLSSGVLNLDSRSYGAGKMHQSRSLVFLRDANAALRALAAAAAADDGEKTLRKLTFTYLAPDNDENTYLSQRHINDGLDALLTGAPAARGLEELRVHVSPTWRYSLRVAALPSYALRTLHLDGLRFTPPQPCSPALASFAWLETLRLYRCNVRLPDLQAIVNAAPLLAALELDLVNLSYKPATSSGAAGTTGQRLRCPRVTVLSLARIGAWWSGEDNSLELDAPYLRHFAYRGFLWSLTLVSPSPASLVRADLHFKLDDFPFGANGDWWKGEECRLFWHFVGEFGTADILNVSFEQPGGRRWAEQIKKYLRLMKGATIL